MAVNKEKGPKTPKTPPAPKMAPPGPSKKAIRQWVKIQKSINLMTPPGKTGKPREIPPTPDNAQRTYTGNMFVTHAKRRPGRLEAAERIMQGRRAGLIPRSSEHPDNSPERRAEVKEWQLRRPQGGGRGVAAPRREWVKWGLENPNRTSMAGRTVAEYKKKDKWPLGFEGPIKRNPTHVVRYPKKHL